MKIKYKIWIERNGQILFGHGRDELLRAIEKYRSLHAAARKLKMSYRAAWGRIRASEERLGFKLVECDRGKSMHITAEAKQLLEQFEAIETCIETLLENVDRKIPSLKKQKNSVQST
ncbi:MAG: winged helix-turn-helix domain-containing protein [Syntrophales bacterium]